MTAPRTRAARGPRPMNRYQQATTLAHRLRVALTPQGVAFTTPDLGWRYSVEVETATWVLERVDGDEYARVTSGDLLDGSAGLMVEDRDRIGPRRMAAMAILQEADVSDAPVLL